MIWNYDMEQINNGYGENCENFQCVICQSTFVKGKVYDCGGELYDAQGAVRRHFNDEHGSMADYLLRQELSVTGISEIQRNLLKLLLSGKSDEEIGNELGIAQSTVRNHRFKLREKEKQSKMYLALMHSLKAQTDKAIAQSDTGVVEEVHVTATMVDDRYGITDAERKKTVDTYMDRETGALKQFPAREKKKIIVLGEIIRNFKRNYEYSEAEVNKILKRIFEEDYPTIRRALIEYGFMDRSKDCKRYRVKE